MSINLTFIMNVLHLYSQLPGDGIQDDSRYKSKIEMKYNDLAFETSFVSYKRSKIMWEQPEINPRGGQVSVAVQVAQPTSNGSTLLMLRRSLHGTRNIWMECKMLLQTRGVRLSAEEGAGDSYLMRSLHTYKTAR